MYKKYLTKPNIYLLQIHIKLGIERNFFHLINDIFKKPTANITLNGERLNDFPKMKNMARRYAFTISIQHILKILASAIGKKMKRHPSRLKKK